MTTSVTTPPTDELDDLALYGIAEDFLDALLDSADVDRIGKTNWWERARTALEISAGSSDTWHQCVARAARRMQIESPSEALSDTTARLATHLNDPAVFRRWARLAERDALAITALVRERRTSRRKTKPKKDTSSVAKPTTTTTKTSEEPECLPF